MPVTNFDYRGMSSLPDVASVLGINNLNNINSLLDEDDYPLPSRPKNSVDRHSLLLMDRVDDQFSNQLRESNTSQAEVAWPNFSRHVKGNKSLPMNTLRSTDGETGATHSRTSSVYETPARNTNRHSMDVAQVQGQAYTSPPPMHSNRSSIHASPPPASTTMPNLRSSLSNNDVPTVNSFSMSDMQSLGSLAINDTAVGANLTPSERLHNHNAGLGRIPSMGHRRETSIGERRMPPSGPSGTNGNYVHATQNHMATTYSSSSPMTQNGATPTHGGPRMNGSYAAYNYGVMPPVSPSMGNGIQQQGYYQPSGPYHSYAPVAHYAPHPRRYDSQQAVILSRRNHNRPHDGKSVTLCLG